jgi:hypothetical protein
MTLPPKQLTTETLMAEMVWPPKSGDYFQMFVHLFKRNPQLVTEQYNAGVLFKHMKSLRRQGSALRDQLLRQGVGPLEACMAVWDLQLPPTREE